MKFFFYFIIFFYICWALIKERILYQCLWWYLQFRVWVSDNFGEGFVIIIKMLFAEIFYTFCMYGELVPFRVLFYDPFASLIFFYFFFQFLDFVNFINKKDNLFFSI
jgi:hypothetical protein